MPGHIAALEGSVPLWSTLLEPSAGVRGAASAPASVWGCLVFLCSLCPCPSAPPIFMVGTAFASAFGCPMFTTARLLRPALASAACRRPSGGWASAMSTGHAGGDAPAVAPSCVPCEGIGSAMDAAEVRKSAAVRLPAWQVAEDGRSLSRTHQVASFVEGMNWFNAITPIAEAEGHHPDLSLVDWNIASVRLSTHALRGVTENDFIVAERIEALPVVLKKPRKAKKAVE